ncbi:MAG: universal stress protein [Thermoproteota archaeon]|nr:universal stress protein [Thermoproteota archaeon]
MPSDQIKYRKSPKMEMGIDSEKSDEYSDGFTDKLQAGVKAVATKINNPGTDINLEYEKEKFKEEINNNKNDTKSASSTELHSQEGYSISKSNLPSFRKILVTHDGKDKSNKAINYSIYLSNLSGAEIIILQIIENVKKLEDTSIDISNKQSSSTTSSMDDQNYLRNVEGQLIDSMEEKIQNIEQAGCKNKVSYKFKTGSAVDEIINEINEINYDLVVLTSSHLDSWIKSLFSDTRKIISNINTPVLIT